MTRLGWLLALCVSAAAQSVEGTAINAVTNIPIAGLKVEVTQGTSVFTVVTDAQGRFQLDSLKEGAFTVRYLSPDYASPRQNRYQAKAGTPVKLEARLNPLPRISGRVVDGRGNAVPKAEMELLSAEVFWLAPADDQGRFDLRVPPGAYLLSASPPPGLKPPDPEPDRGPTGWARTFYPGTAVREGASQINLIPGAVASNMEVKLLAVPVHAIRGVVRNADGSPAPNVKIDLSRGRPSPPAMGATSQSDGRFEFPAVTDGECRLTAQSRDQRAAHWIEVAGRDLEGVTLGLGSPFTVTGKVVVEVPQGMAAPRMPQVHLNPRVSRFSLEFGIGGTPGIAAQMDASGKFALDNVYPGIYTIDAMGRLAPYYLDSIRVGDAEVTTPEVEFSGPAAITLLYKTNGGAVRGTVENCRSGIVWLVPQDPSRRLENFIRDASCDASNRYELTAVRPGDYYAVAGAMGMPRAWMFGIFDDEVLRQATKITVRAGEATTADLRVY